MKIKKNQIIKTHSYDDIYQFNRYKIFTEFIRKDIEKSYNLDIVEGAEAYFSERYGWTLRKSID